MSKKTLTGKHQYAEFKNETVADRVKKCVDLRDSTDISDKHIKLSYGNRKTGSLVPSVSLIPVADCGHCAMCARGCYAVRAILCYPESREALANNSAIAHKDRKRFFVEVDAALKFLRFFRFFVSGDILDRDFLDGMVRVAENNPHCQILAFSKEHEIINGYLDEHGCFPSNLHIILSGWRGDVNVNRHNLPVSSPVWKDGSRSCMVTDKAYWCQGNCTNCAKVNEGCWAAGPGDTILFEAH